MLLALDSPIACGSAPLPSAVPQRVLDAASPASKLLLSHLLAGFPAMTVHISLCSLPHPSPRNPTLDPRFAVRGRLVLTALQSTGFSPVVREMGAHTRALAQPGLCPTAQEGEGDLPLAWFSPRCWCKQRAGRGGINHSGAADEQGQRRNAATCPGLFRTRGRGRRVGTSSLSLHGAFYLFGQSEEMWVLYLQVTCPCWGQAPVSHIPTHLQQDHCSGLLPGFGSPGWGCACATYSLL